MTIEELRELVSGEFREVKAKLEKLQPVIKIGDKTITQEEVLKQYEPATHAVKDPAKRPKKEVTVTEEIEDPVTKEITEKDSTDYVEVARLPIPVQKKIVKIAAAFLVGEKIMLESDPEGDIEKKLLELIRKVWEDNKLHFKSKTIAKLQMSETACAELWYDYVDREYWEGTDNSGSVRRLAMQVLAKSKGDDLYPVFDEFNDLIAFGRGYVIERGDKKIEHLDIYTENTIYQGVKQESGWEVSTKKNPFGKIPVIYYHQPVPEWADVQDLIERKETKFSDFADTNDYFAAPAIVTDADVKGFAKKGEQGRILEIDQAPNGQPGKVEYLTWDQAPAASKMEFEMLDKEIHSGTHTPDISFDTMKQLLSNTSGIALKLLFMDPQLKALDNQEQFGECIQRRLNFLKSAIISLNPAKFSQGRTLYVTPTFRPFMPVNAVEVVNMLTAAHDKGMVSRRTMLELSPLVNDADQELEEIKKENSETKPEENAPVQV